MANETSVSTQCLNGSHMISRSDYYYDDGRITCEERQQTSQNFLQQVWTYVASDQHQLVVGSPVMISETLLPIQLDELLTFLIPVSLTQLLLCLVLSLLLKEAFRNLEKMKTRENMSVLELLKTVLTGSQKKLRTPRGPRPFPIIGSAHLLDGHAVPFAGFTKLREKYGDIFSFQLGSLNCVVINNVKLINEAFQDKGTDFDGRPDFKRFQMLFGGDKDNGNGINSAYINYA